MDNMKTVYPLNKQIVWGIQMTFHMLNITDNGVNFCC